jgi:hypothetical protein
MGVRGCSLLVTLLLLLDGAAGPSTAGSRDVQATLAVKPLPWGGKPCTKLRTMKLDGCRPSYLLIGADKCGTSSLYYYLQAHPQVTAARRKQVQFFDHAYVPGAESYIRNSFPHTMQPKHVTGEASPGYMVYSEVPPRVRKELPEVRILLMARDPVERAWSGYKYNYLRALPPGAKPIPFGTLVRWEIERVLLPCHRAAQRSSLGPGPVKIDMSKSCYGKVPKSRQFKEVFDGKPDFNGQVWTSSSLPTPCAFGCHQLVGRGLYVHMMAWWYGTFPADDIHVVCTEDLSPPAKAAESMAKVAAHIGLDSFDFLPTVSKGKYNVEGHEGYERLTTWGDAARDAHHQMDPATRQYLDEFFSPYSEAFFSLVGKRCSW